MLRDSMENAEDDMRRRLLIEARVDAERVRLALDAALKADGALASEADRKAIAAAAARLDKVRAGEDRELIVAAIEALEAAALPFAQARIDRAIGQALSGRSLDEVEASVASGAAAPRPRLRRTRERSGAMPKMTFIKTDGTRVEVEAPLGLSVLEIAHRNNIDLEGACEGSLACSTCHVIIDPEWYDLLESASDDEEDMLDLAFGLTHTSRLGCQIKITPELDGLTVSLPTATRNMMVEK